MPRWLKKSLVVAAGVLLVVAAWYAWYATRDYAAVFRDRQGALDQAQRTLLTNTTVTATFDVVLASRSGLRTAARLRVPRRPGRYPVALLTVGIETGRRVVDLVEEHDDLAVMALDYGWRESFDISTLAKLLRVLPRLQAIGRDAVPGLLLAVDYLRAQPEIDPDRVILVGVSYGSYFSLAAAALDDRVQQTVILQGGAPIGETLATNAGFWRAPVPPRALGWLGERVFLPFRPERWAGRVAPRRLTFIASRRDAMLPAAGVERVYALAGEPRELIWHDLPHVDPNAAAIITELSRITLDQIRRPVSPSPPPEVENPEPDRVPEPVERVEWGPGEGAASGKADSPSPAARQRTGP